MCVHVYVCVRVYAALYVCVCRCVCVCMLNVCICMCMCMCLSLCVEMSEHERYIVLRAIGEDNSFILVFVLKFNLCSSRHYPGNIYIL